MSRREGIAIVVLIIAAVAFVAYMFGQQRRSEVSPIVSVNQSAPPATDAPQASAPRNIGADTRLIEQGKFFILSFNLYRQRNITVHVSLKSGAAIDSYFVGEDGLNAWQAMAMNRRSTPFNYFTGLTMAPLAGEYTRTATLPPGKYALIIDNSPLGATAPPFHFFKTTPALVEYSVTAE